MLHPDDKREIFEFIKHELAPVSLPPDFINGLADNGWYCHVDLYGKNPIDRAYIRASKVGGRLRLEFFKNNEMVRVIELFPEPSDDSIH